MARMYGYVKGSRGGVHRLGGRSMSITAASWQGAVNVTLYVKSTGKGKTLVETDYARIWLHGSGVYATVYDGPIGKVSDKAIERAKRIEQGLRSQYAPKPKVTPTMKRGLLRHSADLKP